MKEIKIKEQTVVVNTENKDIELYALIPDGKDTWRIVNEDNIFIADIHDYDIEEICDSIYECNDIQKYSAEEFIGRVWETLRDDYAPHIIDCMYSENWDKFCAWCDQLAVEYFATTLMDNYNSRLLDFE